VTDRRRVGEETSGYDRHCRVICARVMEKCGRAGGIEHRETERRGEERDEESVLPPRERRYWIGTSLKSAHRSVRSIFSTYVRNYGRVISMSRVVGVTVGGGQTRGMGNRRRGAARRSH